MPPLQRVNLMKFSSALACPESFPDRQATTFARVPLWLDMEMITEAELIAKSVGYRHVNHRLSSELLCTFALGSPPLYSSSPLCCLCDPLFKLPLLRFGRPEL